MAGLFRTGVLGVFLCSIVAGVLGHPSGAPTSACVSMLPDHGTASQDASTSPFTVTADAVDFTTGEVILVTISGTTNFKGVLLQARVVGMDTPVGVFSNIPNGLKTLACSGPNDAVTHSSNDFKGSRTVEWTAPSNTIGNIEFVATFVYTKQILWTQLRSSVITALPDVCASMPCLNGGTCYKTTDKRSYFCGCPDPMTMGPNCETPCSPNPCLNGGFCQETDGTFSCFCPADRHGERCEFEIVACDPNPCLNGATCINTATGYQCSCADGWSGDDCGTSLICEADSCLNGGTCFDSNPPGRLMYHCECSVFYTGSRCETADPCRADPCANDGTCNQIGDTIGFTCSCVNGFEGERCESTTNPCESSPCLNGGTCFRDTNGDTMCQCPAFYTGDRCEVHPCMQDVTPCLNGGTCFQGATGDSYFCLCPAAYTGQNCDTLVDPCASHPCLNGGSCTQGSADDYVCTCSAEFFGPNCQNQGACFGVRCLNGGTCVPRNDQLAFTCQCATAYDGQTCEYTNNCELNNPCQGGSTCQYNGGGYSQCICPEGLAGTNCEVDISCNRNTCENGGTCTPLGGGMYRCDCHAIYSGSNCGTYTNPCETNPCVNGDCSIVLEHNRTHVCDCQDDYSGENCTIYSGNPCDVLECLNDGTCINSDQGAVCVCEPDYSGANCEKYIRPILSGCPSGLAVSYPLERGSDSAYIDLSLSAVDQNGNSIPITVTAGLTFPSTIRFTEEYREGKDIMVIAVDSANSTSMCSFKLRIFDDESPAVQCPPDVSAITAEKTVAVSFPMATATDNLGITAPLLYTPGNGSQFEPGTSTVIVKALDTFDNQGECSFKVVVHKKESDCTSSTAPDNGVSTCVVDGEQKTCSVTCNKGFGNVVGISEYMCVYQTPAYWDPRPNTDICVPFKPGNGASKEVSIRFTLDSALCDSPAFAASVEASLRQSLQTLGVCTANEPSMSCRFSLECGNGSGGGRRRRANADLNVDVGITSNAGEEDTTADVVARLNEAVGKVKAGAATGSLSIEVEGVTVTNVPIALGENDAAWNCKPGQVTRDDGCLSCPPGTYHDSGQNSCSYCPANTFQNKPEQGSCTPCPKSGKTKQNGAYSADHCEDADAGPVAGPWTPTLIGIVGGAGGLIVLLLLILACVFIIKSSCGPSHKSHGDSKDDPLSNFTHLNKAYEGSEESPEMQLHGVPSIHSDDDTTYQNIPDGQDTPNGSTDHLVRIPSLSQYSDYYATLNARAARNLEPETPPPPPPVGAPAPPASQLNGGPPSAPPAPPAPPAVALNTNNSNTSTDHTYLNGSVANGGPRAKFQV